MRWATLDGYRGRPPAFRASDVDDLVRRAAEHPLGVDFLTSGSLDAVSATFHVHAFVIDAARDVLAAPGAPTTPRIPQFAAAAR